MENSQYLATESFSYSWLIERQPPSSDDSLINNLKQTYHQTSNEDEDNFDFNFPVTTSHSHDLILADEIFSDGQIKPVYVDISKLKALKSSTSNPTSNTTLHPSGNPFLRDRSHHYILGRWRRSSKKILQKCIRLVKPLCRTVGGSRKSRRVDDLERKVFEVRSLSNSLEASPRPSSAYSAVEWSDFYEIGNNFDLRHGMENVKNSSNVWSDAENSINEAILYCKRSIEK